MATECHPHTSPINPWLLQADPPAAPSSIHALVDPCVPFGLGQAASVLSSGFILHEDLQEPVQLWHLMLWLCSMEVFLHLEQNLAGYRLGDGGLALLQRGHGDAVVGSISCPMQTIWKALLACSLKAHLDAPPAAIRCLPLL